MRTYPTLQVDSINRSDDWPQAFPTKYADGAPPLAVTRTQEFQPQLVERATTCLQHAYMMSVNMTTLRATTFVDGKKTLEGASYAGSINIFQPGSTLRCIFHGRLDACIMSLPIELLSAVLEEAELSDGHQGEEILRRVSFDRNRGLLVLFQSLADIGSVSRPFDQLYADSLGMAIVCALLSGYSSHGAGVAHLSEHGLSGRRLRRVEEFVHENISQPISLACLARAAGLSRMHFAAQFRHTTGMSPHNYVLREKIRRAQRTLSSTPTSLLQTALGVGFLSQSHFSTVFKSIVGDTPARWRADCKIHCPIRCAGEFPSGDIIPDGRNWSRRVS
jgi:AraC family transcriptional regulator